MPTKQQEWAAFLALVPYFSGCSGPSKIRTRLLTTIRQCEERIVTRDALLLRSGLSFFAEELEVDLVLMQLIRERVICPVVGVPFTFAIQHSYPKGADSCERSPSKQAAASG
jgi:hypothetical protein